MKKTIKIKKMKKFIFSVIFLIVAVLTQAQGPGQTQTFVNPVIEMDFPDPDIIRVGGDYYMLSTTMHHFPGAPILHSKDLINWEYCSAPLATLIDQDDYNLLGGKDRYHVGMWASALKYHDGTFYLLINTNDVGSWILTANDIKGPWSKRQLDRLYYDSNFMFDDDGRIYIVSGYNKISVSEVDGDFNHIRTELVIDQDNTGLEGNHLYHIGDYYYIYSTYGGLPSGQTVFRSRSPWGPFDEERVLIEKEIDGQINTVHQGALVQTPSGEWWTMLFEDQGAVGRLPNLQPVTWKDEWPIIGDNGKPYVVCRIPDTGKTFVGQSAMPVDDDFSSDILNPQWEWNHQPDTAAYSMTKRKGYLRLYTSGIANNLKYARNTITQRIPGYRTGKDVSATVKIDVSNLADGDHCGLTIFQDPYAYVGVAKDGNKLMMEWGRDTISVHNDELSEMKQPKRLKIKSKKRISSVFLRATFSHSKQTATFSYSTDGKTFIPIGEPTQQWFNLSVFVGSRFGIYNYATKKEGGFVDVDDFSVI